MLQKQKYAIRDPRLLPQPKTQAPPNPVPDEQILDIPLMKPMPKGRKRKADSVATEATEEEAKKASKEEAKKASKEEAKKAAKEEAKKKTK